jgi:predicted HTH transcriptional regulator
MFPTRLSEVTPVEIHALISAEVAEGSDLEFKRELPAKNPPDAWMSGGKIGDEAKDQLATEMIAFANTDGGTLVLGLGEDSVTKKAIVPIHPLPRCKEAANSLFQSISSRVEPRLPMFECAGVVTEQDGASGVVIMRTLSSYLSPHRHTQDRHCYIRRNDGAVPMSMVEIQEMTKRTARAVKDLDRPSRKVRNVFSNGSPQNIDGPIPLTVRVRCFLSTIRLTGGLDHGHCE